MTERDITESSAPQTGALAASLTPLLPLGDAERAGVCADGVCAFPAPRP